MICGLMDKVREESREVYRGIGDGTSIVLGRQIIRVPMSPHEAFMSMPRSRIIVTPENSVAHPSLSRGCLVTACRYDRWLGREDKFAERFTPGCEVFSCDPIGCVGAAVCRFTAWYNQVDPLEVILVESEGWERERHNLHNLMHSLDRSLPVTVRFAFLPWDAITRYIGGLPDRRMSTPDGAA